MRIRKLLKESLWDFIKDHVKLLYGLLFWIVFGGAIAYVKNNYHNNIEVELWLLLLMLLVIIFCLLFIAYLSIMNSRQARYIYEIENPLNPAINNYNVGDEVIIKLHKDSISPRPVIVVSKNHKHIVCKDKKGNVGEYVPEELLTQTETSELLENISKKKKENAIAREINHRRQVSKLINSRKTF